MENLTLNIINIIAIIISPIIAFGISNHIQDRKEKRKEKIQILKILMTQRFSPKNIEYVNALNLIDIVFIDSEKVRSAYKNLYSLYANKVNFNNPEEKENYLLKVKRVETKLIEAIVADLGYKDKITWDAIQEPYIPQWLYDEITKRDQLNNAQLDLVNFVKTLTPQNKTLRANTEVINKENIDDEE